MFHPYSELLRRTDAPPGSSWFLWGADNDLGTLNFITPDSVKAAMASVLEGTRVNLDHPVPTVPPAEAVPPPLVGRVPATHRITRVSAMMLDDRLDNFYLQAGSQVDAFRHCRHPDYGFYNGRTDEEMTALERRLDVGQMADAGIVGRGVLLDLPRYMSWARQPFDITASTPITTEMLDAVADHQGTEFLAGDLLMIRTGAQSAAGGGLPSYTAPGLVQSHDMVEWLWDRQFSVVASDNFTLELHPAVATSPFGSNRGNTSFITVGGRTRDQSTMMHGVLIGLLGMVLGEAWALDELAVLAEMDGRYTSLVVVKPLNVIGGVGSPANAMAIR